MIKQNRTILKYTTELHTESEAELEAYMIMPSKGCSNNAHFSSMVNGFLSKSTMKIMRSLKVKGILH